MRAWPRRVGPAQTTFCLGDAGWILEINSGVVQPIGCGCQWKCPCIETSLSDQLQYEYEYALAMYMRHPRPKPVSHRC